VAAFAFVSCGILSTFLGSLRRKEQKFDRERKRCRASRRKKEEISSV
jgi:hypothetical protein